MKKAKVSMNKGKAIACPATRINVGQSRLSCRPIAVPVTTPTATEMTKPRAQRRASRV
ncbi:hypothetical protein D3C81_2054130 [compost metagenome]